MENASNETKIAALVSDGFEQIELSCLAEAVTSHGATLHVISPNKNQAKAWNKIEWGNEQRVDVPVNMARPEYYDALILPGGVMSTDTLRHNSDIVPFVKHFFEAGKPVAAIGHAPQVLIDANVVLGRKLTSYPSIKVDLENAGAIWIDEKVVTDNGLITSQNTDTISSFIQELLKEFRLEVYQ